MNLLTVKKNLMAGLLTAAIVMMAAPVYAAGLLTPKNSNLPALDIKDHVVKVVIEDGYAVTTVEQTFHNPHGQDLEAVYSFPVPNKGAVSEFTMWINGKPVQGEVLEKQKAREVYEEQKANKRNAGLTEKNEYKTFEISVYPVRAGQDTKIQLGYIQPAHVDTNIGRYVYPLEEGGVDEEALAFWTTNEKVSGRFIFDLILRSDYPVADIRLPNHPQAQVVQNGDYWMAHIDNQSTPAQNQVDTQQALTLNNNDDGEPVASSNIDPSFRLDTDIVVYYRHAENLPGAVDLVAYKAPGSKRGTFMLTVTPGMDLQPIKEGRDWIFVLDISGSMQGKYATLAEGVSRALKKLSALERFRIVVFNTHARELTSGYLEATPENVQQYIDVVTNLRPDQSTNLFDGLQLGLKGLDVDRTSSIILVTDGVANVGVVQQKKFIELIKKYDVRLFTFIMGNSANRPLLEALTQASHGFALNVSNSDDIISKILLAQSKVTHQALHGARLNISGIKVSDVTPRENSSLYRGQQLVVLGHYFDHGSANVSLTGKISGENIEYKTQFDFPETAEDNPEIERIWAYATVEDLMREIDNFGETADIKQGVIDIGTEYGLVTDYTSMVVVEEEVFQQLGIDRSNKRRLEREYANREKRAARPIRQRRVDTQQPMFRHNRPTMNVFSGGAGALDPVSLLAFSPLLWGLKRRRKEKTNLETGDV